uniref:Uncharacterized protein n=1 Tax=viral metagenome TaxID=1070528 RepID=A0A6C0D9P0_9ZZZZ
MGVLNVQRCKLLGVHLNILQTSSLRFYLKLNNIKLRLIYNHYFYENAYILLNYFFIKLIIKNEMKYLHK